MLNKNIHLYWSCFVFSKNAELAISSWLSKWNNQMSFYTLLQLYQHITCEAWKRLQRVFSKSKNRMRYESQLNTSHVSTWYQGLTLSPSTWPNPHVRNMLQTQVPQRDNPSIYYFPIISQTESHKARTASIWNRTGAWAICHYCGTSLDVLWASRALHDLGNHHCLGGFSLSSPRRLQLCELSTCCQSQSNPLQNT